MNGAALRRRLPPVPPGRLDEALAIFRDALRAAPDPAGATCTGVEAARARLVRRIERWGLDDDQRNSLLLRVLAFDDLLARAGLDDRFGPYVAPAGGGYEVTRAFLRAAARAELAPAGPDQEAMAYPLESVLRAMRD